MGNSNQTAVDIQVRYAFYLVALVFTILGLSVQTAHFGQAKVADVAELLGWLSLLFSGLCGLKRIEMMPRFHAIAGKLGTVGDEGRKMIEETIDERQAVALRYFNAQKALMVFGLGALMVSRGYQPVVGLFS